MRRRNLLVTAAVAAKPLVVGTAAVAGVDFGQRVQSELRAGSGRLFGVQQPLLASSTRSVSARRAQSDPRSLFKLAGGLTARVVTNGTAAPVLDQITLWPNDRPHTWLIVCNESDPTQPGLQRVHVATGRAETILTGTAGCDPTRRTPWGTLLFGEEAGGGPTGGATYEMVDPIHTTGVTLDRATGTFSGGTGAANIALRPALGRLSYESYAVYPTGVVYYGDELRPASGFPGGAYYKFRPSKPLEPGTAVSSLNQSPLASGNVYGLRVGLNSGGTDYGQGTQYGFGTWLPLCSGPSCRNVDLRAAQASNLLTGYYRPEDADVDPSALAAGSVRLCSNNTGNESADRYYGETVCITDGTLTESLNNNSAIPQVQQFVIGNPQLAMPDNIDFQPGRNNVVLHEDADTTYLRPHNNDLWYCLPDGTDPDLLSDGCVRIATLNDLPAEWTGGIFDAAGKHFYVSIQHNVSGTGTVLHHRLEVAAERPARGAELAAAGPAGCGAGRVRSAETAGDVVLGALLAGVCEDLLGAVDLDQIARLAGALQREERGGVTDARCLLHVVGDDHDRVAVLQLGHEVLDRQGRDRVERGGRLVHQQHLRLHGDRPGDAQPLLLAAGQPHPRLLQPVLDLLPEVRAAQRPLDRGVEVAPLSGAVES